MNNAKQKFKRGNLVKIAKSLGSSMCHFENDKDAIIQYSYADEYGGDNTNSYSVIFTDTGSSCAWYYESQLTLINEGGEHLFDEAKAVSDKISKQNTDMNYITSKIDDNCLGSESILMLFDMLGHDSSFHRNGEFYVLCSDWEKFYPIFIHIKNAKTLDEATEVFTDKGNQLYNVEKVFNAFNLHTK